MSKRRAMLRGAKWAGLVLGIAVAAGLVASRWWEVQYGMFNIAPSIRGLGVFKGTLFVFWRPIGRIDAVFQPPGLQCNRFTSDWRAMLERPQCRSGPGGLEAELPLWFILLLDAAPTSLLWYADRRATRRARAGHCPTCGYDRAGLAATTPCPECAAAPPTGGAAEKHQSAMPPPSRSL